jgi:hypothetical protein
MTSTTRCFRRCTARLMRRRSRSGSTARTSAPASRSRSLKVTPDPSEISTSYVERQNLTMRMGMRRFTRLTNGFSKKVENLAHAVSLHYMYYNFARVHTSLTIVHDDGTRTKRTPAMAAGVADHVWTLCEIAALLLDSN